MWDVNIQDFKRAKRQVRPPTRTTVQTLILSKDRFKSRESAVKWVKDNGFHAKKVDETENSYRFRQREPGEFQPRTFRTIKLTDGVQAVIGRLKRRQRSEPTVELVKYRVDFISRAEDEQIVTGIVADAENVDAYKNRIPPEEVKRAAWRFMEVFRNLGVGHNKDSKGRPVILNDKIRILESWVTREETTIGGKKVPAVAWLLTVRVLDSKIWQAVKNGQLTGFSFEARARRIPIEAENGASHEEKAA